ncbi:hypothetical protein P7K49_034573 [Saguinus oedipus]|uniref:Uncharacterized protein n=1 Tax=Saguinus oedipus TaxID=9490 RepID=A0ABQ9TV32_SAGOE|nr:hypothetical protein P7K49_034573 [Saguinus oedipus]
MMGLSSLPLFSKAFLGSGAGIPVGSASWGPSEPGAPFPSQDWWQYQPPWFYCLPWSQVSEAPASQFIVSSVPGQMLMPCLCRERERREKEREEWERQYSRQSRSPSPRYSREYSSSRRRSRSRSRSPHYRH